MGVDGSNPHVLIPALSYNSVVWSPDGTKIAFRMADDCSPDGNWELFVVDAAELDLASEGNTLAGAINISNYCDPDDNGGTADRWASWSPDGTKIAFTSMRDGAPYNLIYAMNPDGTGVQQVSSTITEHKSPCWSPR